MKKKERQALVSKSVSELKVQVERTRHELADAILKRASATNTNAVKNYKRTIAQILTVIRQKQEERE